jgi:hypothetical protein
MDNVGNCDSYIPERWSRKNYFQNVFSIVKKQACSIVPQPTALPRAPSDGVPSAQQL